jgi:hypothetical protein
MKTFMACLTTAALTVAITSGASSAGRSAVVQLHRGETLKVDGYSFSCQSTRRTPAFGCAYGPTGGPEQAPVWTVYRGSRLIAIQSKASPRVKRAGGYYETTIKR